MKHNNFPGDEKAELPTALNAMLVQELDRIGLTFSPAAVASFTLCTKNIGIVSYPPWKK